MVKTTFWQKILLIIFGIFLFLICLEIGLRIGGFLVLSLQEYKNDIYFSQKDEYRILCLGESTTQGEYPVFLEKELNQYKIMIKFRVIDKGRKGVNTAIIVSQLENNIDRYKPDLVVTMMGVNDYGPHLPSELASSLRILAVVKSFRVYKLLRLILLHASMKAQTLTETNTFSPINASIYALGVFYMEQGKIDEARQAFVRSIELNPNNELPYLELGRIYKSQNKVNEAESFFLEAADINPKNAWAYFELGNLYRAQGKAEQIQQAFGKSIELNPNNNSAYVGLSDWYRLQGKLNESEQILSKAIELNPKNDHFYAALATVYGEMGNLTRLKEYWMKANRIRQEYYKPVTINNYFKLKQILDRRRIRLVCVQYPVRSIVPLKKIFEDQKGVIFVDNEEIFKNAILKDGYRTYFYDMFGGDFGHCTPKGNKLLAANIASVIIKEIFGK